MGKKKNARPEYDIQALDSAADELLICANCMNGRKPNKCKHEQDCDATVMQRMEKCLDDTEHLQRRMAEKTVSRIKGRTSGFVCKNALTGEYANKVSKAMAETAMALKYTVDVVAGRDTI